MQIAAILLDIEESLEMVYMQQPLGPDRTKKGESKPFIAWPFSYCLPLIMSMLISSLTRKSCLLTSGSDETVTEPLEAWRALIAGGHVRSASHANLLYELLYESIRWDRSCAHIKCKVL